MIVCRYLPEVCKDEEGDWEREKREEVAWPIKCNNLSTDSKHFQKSKLTQQQTLLQMGGNGDTNFASNLWNWLKYFNFLSSSVE